MKENQKIKSKPLYESIYSDLKNKIADGEYSNGDKLPFERELCIQYAVDRITVRRALKLLVNDGLLTKRPGLGSFVNTPLAGRQTEKFSSRNILFTMYNNTKKLNSLPSAFNSALFYAINRECHNSNYSIVYSLLEEHSDLSNLHNGNPFAGMFFVSYIPDTILDLCAKMRVPAICINNWHPKFAALVPEYEKGTYEAVKHLQSMGHRRIGLLTGLEMYYSAQERLRGFYAAMASVNTGVDQNLVIHADWTFSGARDAVLSFIDNTDPGLLPTAFFCMSDVMAIGAMDAFRERGIHVPEKISVMGFDNVQLSNYVSPRLTTMSVDIDMMAKLAMEMIVKAIDSTSETNYVVQVPAILQKRQSVAPPAK